MLQELLASFTQSTQGQQAMQRLQSQGVPHDQASSILGAALPAAAQSMHGQLSGGGAGQGPMGVLDIQRSSYVTNFLSAAVSGLVRGQGLKGAAIDGVQGIVGGHVAQVIASRFGLPTGAAGAIGAVITPLLVDFLWQKMQGGGLNLGSMFGGGGAGGGASATGQAPTPDVAWQQGAASSAQASPTGQAPQGGGVVDSLKNGLGSLFQSDAGSFTPSSFNPYG